MVARIHAETRGYRRALRFRDVEVVVAKHVDERGIQPGQRAEGGREAFRAALDEVAQVSGEVHIRPVESIGGLGQLPQARTVVTVGLWRAVAILRVGDEPERGRPRQRHRAG